MTTAFFVSAKAPLARGEHLYRDVAACAGIGWELLAAVDWMQCKADPRYSPVHGEKLGTLNADGTSYSTKSAALAQCASDLVELAAAVYGIDLTARRRAVGALARRRLRRVPLGRHPAQARRLRHGVPLLRRRADPAAPEDALAAR